MEPHAMAAEDNTPQESPFAKLFSSDAQADKQLQKVRDRIYSFAWSRDRRDEAKLDWVVSENGVNRNVHLKWTGEVSSRSKRVHIDALPCWLLLANKQISADFTRFIYSVNDLDILVDLKAIETDLNKAKLQKVINLLQNANFQRYTRSARVRIHFPDKYPFQDLPAINQHALDNIAFALDEFQELTDLSIRVVPMQGPEVYELRLAAFPFYPMSLTNWSIRMLNYRTFSWDIVAREQLHHLNLAWDLFQETGSLTATVHAPGDAEKPPVTITQAPVAKGADDVPKNLVVGQKKNGSQKRKGRKLKTLSTATAPSASEPTSRVPSADLSLRSTPPSLDLSKDPRSISVSVQDSGSGADPSSPKSSVTELPIRSAGQPSITMSPARDAVDIAQQSSSPVSANKLEMTSIVKRNSAPDVSDEAVQNENIAEQHHCPASPIETAPEECANQQSAQQSSPASSAPSSVTLGRDQSGDEIEIHDTVEEPPQEETTMRGAGADSEKPAQKKRRNRKKGKKTKLADTAGVQSNDDSSQQNPAEAEKGGHTILISAENAHEINMTDKGSYGLFFNGQRPFPLSEIAELIPLAGTEQLLQYTKIDGSCGILCRSPELDRLVRQKERQAAQEAERQAEKLRAKGKRKSKKVKEVIIRRKEPSDGLRRRLEDSKQLATGKQGSDLRKLEDTKQLASGKQGSDLRKRFGEITGEGLGTAVPVRLVSGPEDFDSSDSSPEDTPSSPEQANYSQRGSPFPHEDLGMSSISNRHQPSSSAHVTVSQLPRSTQAFPFHHDFRTVEEDSQVEHRNRQMDEQRLVEEVEDSDDRASVFSQYGDEGPPSISDDESQSPAS